MQCAIPVFDGLLPAPHNTAITELLFDMAHWHALAKLRMHTDLTLQVMDAVTISLGHKIRAFIQDTCPAFSTKELQREFDARVRRETRKSGPKSTQDKTAAPTSSATVTKSKGRKPKTFNLNTYKGHSLGDYPDTIRKYGTTDSYSTEPVCENFNLQYCRAINN